MHPIKILMADDEETVLEIMSRKISAQGYEVVTANNGEEAWEKILSENPDVIILDLNMPKVDGWTVLSRLRKDPPSKKWQPVIIVSAQAELDSIKKGVSLEADHYLIKPCRLEDIAKAIRMMVALIPPTPILIMMFKILTNILLVVLSIMGILFILVRYLEAVGVFFPSRVMNVNPSVLGLPFEDIYFKTKNGSELNGWFFKNPQAHSTILFAHGNAGNISDRLLKVRFFHDLGLNVFIFDYQGYGKSQGKPSEAGIYEDAQAAFDVLQKRPDIDPSRVIAYGTSLGGIVAIDLAGHRPVAALIVDSSITSAHEMARILYPYVPSWMSSIKFDSISKVKNLTMPKLFLHSPEDHVVPFWMGKKLFEAAAEPKTFLQVHGGHNDVSIATDPQAAKAFVQFLKDHQL